ncbi:20s cyclosome subunit (nuc2 cdc27) [Vairimorpha apis BRL 01]|uniref:20s cyclosome subunit ( nuc2 cdc27) n=1 Tax=Vairimorpha apis BRL 01 TaxID=1037528 RepID=T0MH61_9MICR|nr:20s cyclosome subunit (nuc2 cdc27) [Vairimorpha apis BRL 01]
MNTPTSIYYEFLCYKKIKEFKKALNALKSLLYKSLEIELLDLENFIVDLNDKEHFYNEMGLLHTQLYDKDSANKFFLESFSIFPLYNTVENIINEGLNVNIKTNTYYDNVIKIMLIKEKAKPFLLKEPKPSYHDILDKYIQNTPGIGSYILAFLGKQIFDLGYIEESKKIFYLVRSKDPKFIIYMDYLSTALWHSSDITELGILCKNLIIDSPNHPNTWKALGNFYNHKNDYSRSMLSLKRSRYIINDYTTLNLLGFESIHRNEYLEALDYFKKSQLMLKNNYKSYYGCALVYEKLDKKDSADYFYRKCFFNNQMKVMGMKFYIKNNNIDAAIKIYKNAFEINTSDITKIIKMTIDNKEKFDRVEEFLVLEFVEVLIHLNLLDHALNVLHIVEYRGDTYYKKREMIFEKKHNLI